MSYHLLNIETLEYYYCDDQAWISAIDIAKENYWDPDGTIYDIIYNADEKCFDADDSANYIFIIMTETNESDEWDGNYIEKRNQIITYEDTIYLPSCLEGTGVETGLIEFIKKGSFRICSE